MAGAVNRLTAASRAPAQTPARREPRNDVVRIVEYTRFPRVGSGTRKRLAFTRDLSVSGMCIGADEPEPPDSLLRVTLRNVDGGQRAVAVDRVVWCCPTRDGRWWIGLESLTETHLS
jgi:hypothetical protein